MKIQSYNQTGHTCLRGLARQGHAIFVLRHTMLLHGLKIFEAWNLLGLALGSISSVNGRLKWTKSEEPKGKKNIIKLILSSCSKSWHPFSIYLWFHWTFFSVLVRRLLHFFLRRKFISSAMISRSFNVVTIAFCSLCCISFLRVRRVKPWALFPLNTGVPLGVSCTICCFFFPVREDIFPALSASFVAPAVVFSIEAWMFLDFSTTVVSLYPMFASPRNFWLYHRFFFASLLLMRSIVLYTLAFQFA